MKHFVFALVVVLFSGANLFGQETGKLIFQDDFERAEADDTKEQLGNGWTTNSKRRAKGNKQVDLRDGAMFIYIHEQADHAVSVVHAAEIQDGMVSARIKLDHAKDSFTFNFADPTEKSVHAGHLFKVSFKPNSVQIQDLKTGIMRLDLRTARKAGKKVPADVSKMLKTKSKSFQHKMKLGQWYDVAVSIRGENASVTINGQAVGAFSSAGIGHKTKKLLRLSVPRQAYIDDLKIFRHERAGS